MDEGSKRGSEGMGRMGRAIGLWLSRAAAYAGLVAVVAVIVACTRDGDGGPESSAAVPGLEDNASNYRKGISFDGQTGGFGKSAVNGWTVTDGDVVLDPTGLLGDQVWRIADGGRADRLVSWEPDDTVTTSIHVPSPTPGDPPVMGEFGLAQGPIAIGARVSASGSVMQVEVSDPTSPPETFYVKPTGLAGATGISACILP
jgi:hypothetical protein